METSSSGGNRLRALIVEDSEDDAQLLIRQLRRAGYEPLTSRVDTAEEMSRQLDEQTWDLVVADYSMPNFNATEALAVLHQKGLDIPFIILSATIGEETAVEAMVAGAHDYIMKGSSARLVPAIHRELREARERATRRSAERALEENERRFRSLIENSSDIITVIDDQGRMRYASPSVEKLLGYQPEDLIGTQLSQHMHPDDAEAVLDHLVRSSSGGEHSVEFRFRERNGKWRTLEATVNYLLDNPDINGIVLNCRDVTARKRDEDTIRHLAYFDALTDLPNRMLFDDRLAQSLAHSRRKGAPGVAIMFLDIDRFKTINDTLGHGAGDELLRSAAQRLSPCLREEDTLARLGGDDFLFLIPEVSDVETAARIAQKILDCFSKPFRVLDHELHVTGSLGISMFPSDGNDAETLIRNADTALHRAKEQGRNRYQLYAPAMNAVAFQRLVLENNLRYAVERNEFALHYQPLVSLETGATVGVEALIRWQHPELGRISPADFVPMAEETGVIVPMTQWVLRTACAQMKSWLRSGINLQTMSLNVSPRFFNDSNLPEMVGEVLRATELEGHYLSIELTESVMMGSTDATIDTLQQLKQYGVKISIDDFGTGYSSLSYLKRLPIDTLKIDQSFVRDIPNSPDAEAIAVLIIGMAHSLKLSVVAEGVETQDQKLFLQFKGCDIMQGYLVSRPLPTDEITTFLKAQ
jgi:diguanylate cyclase (GGDEF)-like protein/PAS domain S-box-containing protein